LYWTLHAADVDVGVCLLAFPISTFAGALLIGLWPSLHQMGTSSDAPFWILLGLCALFTAWALWALRTARRNFAKAGMPPRGVRERIARVWIAVAVFMLLAGGSVFAYLVLASNPDWAPAALLGPAERPMPLAITFIVYVMAGALLLGRSWWELQDAKSDPELQVQVVGRQETAKAAEWTRESSLYQASRSGEGILVFVFATTFLALLIGLGHRGDGRPNASRLVLIGLFAFASWLSLLLVRRSRRFFEAAGLSQEDVRREVASIWRMGAILMTVIGAVGSVLLVLAFDVLNPADRPWSLASGLTYTAAGLFLLWKNRKRRAAPGPA
jgi:hypothetical protein